MNERSAVEALRAGVPNRAAIRLLGTNEAGLRETFLARLNDCASGLREDRRVEGVVIAGGFGTGKSHLLGYLQELALQENFIVSLVPISKETPLFDPAKVYASAVRNAYVPHRNDDVMTAVMSRLRPATDPYDELEHWASGASSRLAPIFPALLHVIPKRQPDDHAAIARFFGGARLSVSRIRQWLKEAGAAKLFDLKMPKAAELALQRVRFSPRLFAAAGYAGWCVLLDEVELIGRYSALQRGKSYAELTRWLGLHDDTLAPGVVCVCAITDDFTSVVINNRRDDELVPDKLARKGLEQQAILASLGIQALEKRQQLLQQPSESILQQSLHKVQGLYRDAYDWRPSQIDVGERLAGKSMRQYIKSWITAWDIERLYGERQEISTDPLAINYTENVDIERAPEEPAEEDDSD